MSSKLSFVDEQLKARTALSGNGNRRDKAGAADRPLKSSRKQQIVEASFDANLWHRWLAEHNERMRNPAVALREKP